MNRIGRQISSFKDAFSLVAAIVISLILLSTNNNSQIDTLRRGFVEFSGTFLEKMAFFQNLISAYHENIELKKQNTSLQMESLRYQDALLENIRLRKLMGFRQRVQFEMIPAIVTGHGASLFSSTIVLDVGENQGVASNLAVVTADGLVGKIVTASPNHSTAHILLDRNFRVSAKIQRTRLKGIVRWERDSQCTMDGIARRADVQRGDVVITSGYSDLFPPGLKIGVVSGGILQPNSLFKHVTIQPTVDFSTLEEVFILKSFNPDSAALREFDVSAADSLN